MIRKLAIGITVLCLSLAFGATQSMAQGSMSKEGGWIDLLNKGSNGLYNKEGWNHYGPGYFTLDRKTGVLQGHGGMGLFWYSAQMFGDFVLELDFKVDDIATNSGVFLRVPYVPTSVQYIYDGFEIQIYDAALDASRKHVMHEGAKTTGEENPTLHVTGAIYDAHAPSAYPSKPVGEWNHYKITCKGMHITVELNGQVVNDWDEHPAGKVATCWPKGYIGLQNHPGEGSVYFRNIRVMPL